MHSSIKPLLGLVLAAGGSALVFGFRTSDTALPTTARVPTTTSAPQSTAGSTDTSGDQTATATPAPTTAAANAASTGQYADGTYAGAAVREPWGTFEVQAVIEGGRLVDVKLVAAPTDRHSSQINSVAVPLLTESAVASQSAEVDMVSGATWTTESYAQSLQAALDAAAAAASTQQTAG